MVDDFYPFSELLLNSFLEYFHPFCSLVMNLVWFLGMFAVEGDTYPTVCP